jgi:hypothetical protein
MIDVMQSLGLTVPLPDKMQCPLPRGLPGVLHDLNHGLMVGGARGSEFSSNCAADILAVTAVITSSPQSHNLMYVYTYMQNA